MPVWGCYRHHSHTYKPPPLIFSFSFHFSIFFLQIATSDRKFSQHPLPSPIIFITLFLITPIVPKKMKWTKIGWKKRRRGVLLFHNINYLNFKIIQRVTKKPTHRNVWAFYIKLLFILQKCWKNCLNSLILLVWYTLFISFFHTEKFTLFLVSCLLWLKAFHKLRIILFCLCLS